MASYAERDVSASKVAEIVNFVRRRWRLRHVIAGGAVVVAVVTATVWLVALMMQRAGFEENSIAWGRLVVGVVTSIAAARWVLWPLMRRVPDDRVALYAEERLPALDGALLSAVEAVSPGAPREIRESGLVRGLVRDVARRLEPHGGAAVEERAIRQAGAVLTGVALLALGLLLFGPPYLRQAALLIATPWRSAADVAPYSIAVTPGDAAVARGGDQQIGAELRGFTSELVELVVRRGRDAEWERIPMGPVDSARFEARLFDLDNDVEYYVQSSGVRSPIFRLTVKNLPAVRRVTVELTYPPYTGLAPERIEDGGDIAAVQGTRVRLAVRTTLPATEGRLVLDGDSSVALRQLDDSTLVGELVVSRDAFYRIDLVAVDGTRVAGSVEYVIDAIEDQPPAVSIRRPGRDTRPTSVEEVFVEVLATDDYGVGKIELVYSVNGGAERPVVLHDVEQSRLREVTAGHTLFLEEMGLQPGDVVSYYARATESRPGGAIRSSDIYFMTVRPFGRDYRQNQSGAPPGGGGQAGENAGALTQRQREIVAATFKTERDRPTMPTERFREDVTTILLSQGQLRGQVEELAQRMNRPVVLQRDTSFRVIAEYLLKAVEEMKSAEERLAERDTKAALPPEQRALQALERAEAVFREVQVSMGGQQGGGGGGGEASAEDLADLFELETDRLRNQYEQVRRGEQQSANAELDATLERLKQLAARQQQEEERARQRLQNLAQQGGGGGGSQRQLADEAEQLARQLERLAREQRSPELAESARRLQEAANEMRRAAANQNERGPAGSASSRLEEARRLLEEARRGNEERSVGQAAQRAAELAREQREAAQEAASLASVPASERARRLETLDRRKEEMAGEVQRLQDDLEQLGRDLRRERPQTAREVQEAAARMRDSRLRDKIQFSRGVVRQGTPDYVRNFENSIQEDLDSLSVRLARAAENAGREGRATAQGTLDRARDLVRGLTSLDERMRAREEAARSADREQSRAASQGRDGQQGQQGQEGRQGRQGQQGVTGQQQGQGGQQGQQGQEGQQGQQGQGRGTGAPQAGGGMPNAYGQPGGGPGRVAGIYSPDDIRQFGRELRYQRAVAEELRGELRSQGIDPRELDALIERMRALESQQLFEDPEELARLRAAVVEGFKRFEFGLRVALGASGDDKPMVGSGGAVPEKYRDQVSEYFKSLSRQQTPPPRRP